MSDEKVGLSKPGFNEVQAAEDWCLRCRYFHMHRRCDAELGECRVSPPERIGYLRPGDRVERSDGFFARDDGVWPVVSCLDWCGQFSPAADHQLEARRRIMRSVGCNPEW